MTKRLSLDAAVVILVLANLAIIGADGLLRYRIRGAEQAITPGRVLPALAGVVAPGILFQNAAANGHPCHVVRFASRYCPACSARRSRAYDLLSTTLAGRGCDVTVLAPGAYALPAGTAVGLRAVSFDFAQASGFTATPTTLVFDRNWKILWSAVGAFGEDAAREGIRRAL